MHLRLLFHQPDADFCDRLRLTTRDRQYTRVNNEFVHRENVKNTHFKKMRVSNVQCFTHDIFGEIAFEKLDNLTLKMVWQFCRFFIFVSKVGLTAADDVLAFIS
jgi:hypothetical protein